MVGREKMRRVSRRKPCPICGKPDWCLVAPDRSAAICARVEDASVKRCGDAGWLHVLRRDFAKRLKRRDLSKRIIAEPAETEDKRFEQLAEKYRQQLSVERLCILSESLGVSVASLKRLRIGWDGRAYTFPMSNDFGNVVGIRRRFPDGRKVSLTGSKTGLFVPTGLDSGKPLLICEGTTDTAAALDLAFDAIGRPNCNSKIEMTAKAAKGRTEIVIVGDADAPGRAGAEKLADALALHYATVKIIYPLEGIKDLRQWFRAGLSREVLQQLIQRAKPVVVRISFQG